MTATGGAPLTTTVGVVDGVHGHTTHGGAHAQPAGTTGLAERAVLVLTVGSPHRWWRGRLEELAHFARGEANRGVLAFFGGELTPGASRTSELAALARLELHVVDDGPTGMYLSLSELPGLMSAWALETSSSPTAIFCGADDVALLAISVVQQRDVRRTVRIILDRGDLGGHARLVTLEVDDAVAALVTTTVVAHRDATAVVATAGL